MSSDDLEKRADRTLNGLDPKNTVYLHGFDQVCTVHSISLLVFDVYFNSIRTRPSMGSCMQTK